MKIFYFILLFLSLTRQKDTKIIQKLKLGQYQDINFKYKQSIKTGNQKQLASNIYFQIDTIIPNQDINIILLSRKDVLNSPVIYYSTENNQPDGFNKNDFLCELQGGVDICTIENKKLKKNKLKFYLGVYCIADCQFQLKVNYNQPTDNLNFGEQRLLNFQTHEPQVLKIFFPAQQEKDLYEQKIFTQILIEAFLLNPFEVSSNFKIYAKKGNLIPDSNNFDYSSQTVWKSGQTIKILSFDQISEWDVLQDQNFTILLEADIDSRISLKANIYKLTRPIDLNYNLYDTISKDDYMTYELSIPPSLILENSTEAILIRIEIEPYQGIPDLFINYQAIPELLDQSQWQVSLQNDEDIDDNNDGYASIVINYSELIKNNSSQFTEMTDSKFYLNVYAKTSTTFRLKASVSSWKQTEWTIIEFDSIEAGYLQPSQSFNYLLQIQPQNLVPLKVQMTTLTGKAIIYIKYCQDSQDIDQCSLTENDIINRDSLKNKGVLFYNDDKHFNTIDFSTNHKFCTNACYFSITIISLVEDAPKNTHYMLVAKHQKSSLILKENQQYKSYLQKGEIEYFKFELNYQNDETVERISVQIDIIQGELVSFFSSKNGRPNLQDHEITQNNDFQIYKFDIINEKNQNLHNKNKQYFISLESKMVSTYTIQVKIQRKDSNNGDYRIYDQIQKIKLHFGMPSSSLLYPGWSQEKYFFILPASKNQFFLKTNIIIYYETLNESNYNKVLSNAKPPIVNIYHSYKHYLDEFQENVTIVKSQNTSKFLYFQIYSNFSNPGKYVIELQYDDKDNKDIMIKYTISINQDDILELASEQGFINELNSGERDNFEIQLLQPSQIYFELFDCFGQFEIFGAKSQYDIEQQNYSIQHVKIGGVRRINYHQLITFNVIDLSSFYFSVQSKEQQGFFNKTNYSNESLYMIIAHILEPNQINPYDVFYAPYDQENSTAVAINQFQKHSYQITFKPIQIDEFQINTYKIVQEQYILHTSDSSESLVLYSKCNIDDSNLENLFIQGNLEKPFHYKESIIIQNNEDLKNESIYRFKLNIMPTTNLYLQIHSTINIVNVADNYPQTLTFLYDPFTLKYTDYIKEVQNNTENQNVLKNINSQEKSVKSIQTDSNSQDFIFVIIFLVVGAIIALLCAAYWVRKYRNGLNLLPSQRLSYDSKIKNHQNTQGFVQVQLSSIVSTARQNKGIQDFETNKIQDSSINKNTEQKIEQTQYEQIDKQQKKEDDLIYQNDQ